MEIPDLQKYKDKFSQQNFIEKIQRIAKRAGAKLVYIALILYYLMQSDKVSLKDKAIIIGTLGYLISPIDVVPDAIPIAGLADDLFINLDEVELKRKEAQRLEFHKNYIDIQVPLLQDETMGWTALSDLDEPDIAYNPKRDCGFYTQGAKEYFRVKPGQFTIFFPEDAHAPIIGNGKQRKLVGKIRV